MLLESYLQYLQSDVLLEKSWFDRFRKKKSADEKSVDAVEKEIGMSAKKKGFFDKCVKKFKGKMDKPESYCAKLKDIEYGSTYWRGKGKSRAKIWIDTRKNPNRRKD